MHGYLESEFRSYTHIPLQVKTESTAKSKSPETQANVIRMNEWVNERGTYNGLDQDGSCVSPITKVMKKSRGCAHGTHHINIIVIGMHVFVFVSVETRHHEEEEEPSTESSGQVSQL